MSESDQKHIQLSVVIPVCNESGNLHELERRLSSVLARLSDLDDFEIIFVDDGSVDGSALILGEFSSRPHIRTIFHKRRLGQTAAIKSGFQSARFEYCLTMDGDLQVDPEDIPRLLAFARGNDVVNAKRAKRVSGFLLILSSKIYNLLMNLLFQSRCSDSSSNFTLFRTVLVKELPLMANDHRYLLPLVMRKGARNIKEVEVRHSKRSSGFSKYSVLKAIPASFELLAFCLRLSRGYYD
jgi:dolichol-phosphate mannosyltransferase